MANTRRRQQEKITGQLPYGTRRGRLRMPAAISAHEDFIRPRDGSRHPDTVPARSCTITIQILKEQWAP